MTLGPAGVEEVHALGPLSALEKEALDKAVPDLIAQVGEEVTEEGSTGERWWGLVV